MRPRPAHPAKENMMKTPMVVLLALLALPAFADDADKCPTCHLYLNECAAIQKLYDAWVAKGGLAAAEKAVENKCGYPKCRVGEKMGNPERSDPSYLAWKELYRSYRIGHEVGNISYRRSEFPDEWEAVQKATNRSTSETCGNLSQWANWHHGKTWYLYGGDKSSVLNDPPYGWGVADDVDSTGRAVDKKGQLDPSGVGNKSLFKYLIFPFGMAVAICLYFRSKGSEAGGVMGCGFIVGYALLTDPWAVAAHFLAIYMIIGYVVIAAFAGGVKLIAAIAKKS